MEDDNGNSSRWVDVPDEDASLFLFLLVQVAATQVLGTDDEIRCIEIADAAVAGAKEAHAQITHRLSTVTPTFMEMNAAMRLVKKDRIAYHTALEIVRG